MVVKDQKRADIVQKLCKLPTLSEDAKTSYDAVSDRNPNPTEELIQQDNAENTQSQ